MSFLSQLPPDGPARDLVILGAIHTGHLDTPTLVDVPVGKRVVIRVSADYLTIFGERVPMAERVAQEAVDSLGGLLPTPLIVDAIENIATIVPLPTWAPPAGQSRAAQTSSEVFALCEERTRDAFAARHLVPWQLVAGHRKDVVLAAFMPPGRVVIYGARWPDGRRLQPLHPIPGGLPGHNDEWEDYAQGTRLVHDACLLDGQPASVREILSGPLAHLLGGPVAMLRYPTATAANRPTDPAPASTPAPVTTPTGMARTLGYGMLGNDVKELQRLLTLVNFPLPNDGKFGPRTLAAVKEFQGDHGLTIDGRAGPNTMKALWAAAADAMPETSPAPLPFIKARNYRVGRARPIRVVVLHTAEIAEVSTAAENLAAWASGPNAPMASWHFCLDDNSTIQCVREEDTAFAAPGANADGIQIELGGRASQTAADWADSYSQAVLARCARLVAEICERHGFPLTFVDAAGLLRGEKGITTHAEVTKAYRQSTHTDPGKGFPMAAFVEMVRSEALKLR